MRQRPSAYIYPLVYPCILSPPPRHTHPFLQFIYADALHDFGAPPKKKPKTLNPNLNPIPLPPTSPFSSSMRMRFMIWPWRE